MASRQGLMPTLGNQRPSGCQHFVMSPQHGSKALAMMPALPGWVASQQGMLPLLRGDCSRGQTEEQCKACGR